MRPEFLTWAGAGEDPQFDQGVVADALCLVDVHARKDAVAAWTYLELVIAFDWAMREHLAASDNRTKRRDKPSFVTAAEARQVRLGMPGDARHAMLAYIGGRGVTGATVSGIIGHLTGLNLYPSRDAVGRWLREATEDGLVKHSELGRWQIVHQGREQAEAS